MRVLTKKRTIGDIKYHLLAIANHGISSKGPINKIRLKEYDSLSHFYASQLLTLQNTLWVQFRNLHITFLVKDLIERKCYEHLTMNKTNSLWVKKYFYSLFTTLRCGISQYQMQVNEIKDKIVEGKIRTIHKPSVSRLANHL